MTIALPDLRVGRLVRQPRPSADVRRQPCAAADVRMPDPSLHDDATRLAELVRGLHHGTATLRRPDLLGAGLRRLCDDAARLRSSDDRLVDDLRVAASLAVHALQSRPLALATAADFDRLDRLAGLLTALAAASAPDPGRRPDGADRARSRRSRRADRALFS
ncbi:hypothetical protein [Actinomycetospora sp. CA-084318]|uniref:hypothetical protein n=1 Tax=Actinomycetospora sp. CA-084318 TaxID=3239892 RepID=UPI003D952D02